MSPSPARFDKRAIRDRIRQSRRSLADPERARFNGIINQRIVDMARGETPAKIGAYLAFDGEPDIETALRSLAADGYSIYLPVLNQHAKKPGFDFRHWLGPGLDFETGLTRNDFGIQEPRSGNLCEAHDLSILFIPLLAWDEKGTRLGMGGGYYDRVLADLVSNPLPRRIGVAYQLQKIDGIPSEPHDIPLHEVLTETGVFTCPG